MSVKPDQLLMGAGFLDAAVDEDEDCVAAADCR
jgi:hypothetical protein